jgi:6-pyruvoyltetrahydropterin/6-carboxytetrahydropterin synthase
MKYSVTKQFTFEAAHRLLKNYTGKCTNNHGHSWIIKLHIETDELDEKDMVIDFMEMKRLKLWIDEHLDHASILWEKDPMCDYIGGSGQHLFTTKSNPTSEVIGKIIFEQARILFENSRVKVKCVEVDETCTSGAQIFGEEEE